MFSDIAGYRKAISRLSTPSHQPVPPTLRTARLFFRLWLPSVQWYVPLYIMATTWADTSMLNSGWVGPVPRRVHVHGRSQQRRVPTPVWWLGYFGEDYMGDRNPEWWLRSEKIQKTPKEIVLCFFFVLVCLLDFWYYRVESVIQLLSILSCPFHYRTITFKLEVTRHATLYRYRNSVGVMGHGELCRISKPSCRARNYLRMVKKAKIRSKYRIFW
jgi:hypothetical protein